VQGKKILRIIEELSQLSFGKSDKYGVCRIATLEELFQWAREKDIYLNLDCKIQTNEFAENIATKVVSYGMSGRCMYQTNSNNTDRAKIILQIDPKASFVWKYNRCDYGEIRSVVKDPSAVYLYIPVEEVTKERFDMAKMSEFCIMISNVSETTYKKAMDFHPDMIEFLSNTNMDELNRLYIESK